MEFSHQARMFQHHIIYKGNQHCQIEREKSFSTNAKKICWDKIKDLRF